MSESSNSHEFVSVYTAYGQLAGEMIRLLLQSRDIPAILSQESAGATFGLTVGRLGEVKILVPVARIDEAKQILREMDEGKLATDLNLETLSADGPRYKNNKLSHAEILKNYDI